MKYFEEGCKDNNIKLYVLPPRSLKYNGRIEIVIKKEIKNVKPLINIKEI